MARPIDVEESQRHSRHPVGGPCDQAQPLLHELVERVDRAQRRRLALRGRHRLEHRAVLVLQVPKPAPQLSRGSLRRRDDVAVPPTGGTFAIDAHRGGTDEPFDGTASQNFQENRGTDVIDVGIGNYFVHALADADQRGQVDDRVDTAQSALHGRLVTDVADEQFGIGRQIA